METNVKTNAKTNRTNAINKNCNTWRKNKDQLGYQFQKLNITKTHWTYKELYSHLLAQNIDFYDISYKYIDRWLKNKRMILTNSNGKEHTPDFDCMVELILNKI